MESVHVTCFHCQLSRVLLSKDRDYQQAVSDPTFQYVCRDCRDASDSDTRVSGRGPYLTSIPKREPVQT